MRALSSHVVVNREQAVLGAEQGELTTPEESQLGQPEPTPRVVTHDERGLGVGGTARFPRSSGTT